LLKTKKVFENVAVFFSLMNVIEKYMTLPFNTLCDKQLWHIFDFFAASE